MNKQFVPFAALAAAAIFVFAIAPGVARASPTNYNESIDGDLPETGAPLPTFNFEFGANFVSGVSGVTFGSADFDSFAFKIPNGLDLIGGSLAISDLTGDVTSLGWDLRLGSANSGGGTSIAILGGVSPGTFVLTSLGAATYNLTALGVGGSLDRTAGYTFTFVLGTVPGPASVCVFALPGLVVGRRVRR